MATTSYTIYSHYDPKQRTQLERETGQRPWEDSETIELDSAEIWDVEAQIAFPKRNAPPPRFVPALGHPPAIQKLESAAPPSADVAAWYRSLTGASTSSTSPTTFSSAAVSSQPVPRPAEKKSKNNWFIMNAIASSSAADNVPPTAAPSTLADILARAPPPLPHEEQYQPPVFLAIGPANKGFAMLQNSGWSEGEPLGPHVARRPPERNEYQTPPDMIAALDGNPGPAKPKVKVEVLDAEIEKGKGTVAAADIIDLTMSDSDSEDSDSELVIEHDNTLPPSMNEQIEFEGSSRKALITPIATVLKSDRLGIGLKAKTTGPYKESQKRITHNAAAMAAHVKAAEALRKQKKLTGRGHRGFARKAKAESVNRRDLLAYMNT